MVRILLIVFLSFSFVCEKNNSSKDDVFFKDFEKVYRQLNIPLLSFDYAGNFRNIGSHAEISKQEAFFNKFAERLKSIDRQKLSKDRKIDFDLVEYEIKLNLERLELEKRFIKNKPEKIAETNI